MEQNAKGHVIEKNLGKYGEKKTFGRKKHSDYKAQDKIILFCGRQLLRDYRMEFFVIIEINFVFT
jgi:hypothetical protein